MNTTQVIQKTPLFRNLDSESLQELLKECQLRKIAKGKQLFSIGDTASALFVIVEGWIKLYRISRDGEEAIIHIFGPGESFAEAAVFSEQQKYPVNAQAVEDVEVIAIPRQFFIRKIEQDSHFALTLLSTISARQHFLVQQVEQITTRSAPQRIGAFLLRFCRENKEKNGILTITLPYDKSVISTRLNIKPETFSRALAKLSPYGVRINGAEITILSRSQLANFCDIPDRDIPC